MLKEIAASHDKTVGPVMLRWNTQRGVVVIPKSPTRSASRKILLSGVSHSRMRK